MHIPQEDLEHLITERRTYKPAWFDGSEPDYATVRHAIDVARKAPNHHRTEPARFYLLDRNRIQKVGKLFGEIVAGDNPDDYLREKAKRKTREWGSSPGLLIVTCHTDHSSGLVLKNPTIIEEDYATCCCICQNLLLLLHNLGIAAKWSTGPVWKHPRFREVVGIGAPPPDERVVALLFYGHTDQIPPARTFAPLDEHLQDHAAKG